MRRWVLVLAGLLGACAVGSAVEDDAGTTGPGVDAGRPDVSTLPVDGGPVQEAGGHESGAMDAAPPVEAGTDAGVTCPGPEVECGGKCVNTSTDTSNCGGCSKVCALAGDAGLSGGGTWDCDAGACEVQCPKADGGATTFCTDGCYDTTSNAAHCGSCATSCTGKSCCSSSCVDTTSDSNNCGACGKKCPGGESCKSGVCCTSPPSGTCGQSLCTDTGNALTPGCDPSGCVNNVCSYDPYCCSFDWDSVCASEVASYCSPYTCGGGC